MIKEALGLFCVEEWPLKVDKEGGDGEEGGEGEEGGDDEEGVHAKRGPTKRIPKIHI